MKIISDLQIHSKYSRATSKDLILPNIEKWAKIKGIQLMGTGDFQHPKWNVELKRGLTENGTGILKSKTEYLFLLTSEISLIYSQDGKGRRIHQLLFAPSFDVVDQITEFLKSKGRIDYDGRPIFGFSSIELVEEMHSISPEIEVIPAHVWTPWFGVFGSMGGFNSLKDCFQEKEHLVHAIETGISSDPEMNWRLKELENRAIISNSDAHSFWPWRLGREATIYDVKKLTYKEIIKCIRNNENFSTIEFFPEEGKYHYNGHRACNVTMSPAEAIVKKNICPNCKSQMTRGVAHRIEELANFPEGHKPKTAKSFTKLIPLSEVIAGSIGAPVASKKVWEIYNKMISIFGNEFEILLNAREDAIAKASNENIARILGRIQRQEVTFKPGYDGVYGVPIIDGFAVKHANK